MAIDDKTAASIVCSSRSRCRNRKAVPSRNAHLHLAGTLATESTAHRRAVACRLWLGTNGNRPRRPPRDENQTGTRLDSLLRKADRPTLPVFGAAARRP